MREEDELVINGDPNEVVKTLTARRDLEIAYSSDSDIPDSQRNLPTCANPMEARKIMERKWASKSPASTPKQAAPESSTDVQSQ